MSDFATTWNLTRLRLHDTIKDLNHEQLNWRISPNCLTIAEAALHVAGVEVSFSSQLQDLELDEFATRLRSAGSNGITNDKPFPYSPEEMTPDLVATCLELAASLAGPLLNEATEEVRAKQIQSALGPMIDGNGAFARMAAHPFYHQGQAYLIRNSPGFPN